MKAIHLTTLFCMLLLSKVSFAQSAKEFLEVTRRILVDGSQKVSYSQNNTAIASFLINSDRSQIRVSIPRLKITLMNAERIHEDELTSAERSALQEVKFKNKLGISELLLTKVGTPPPFVTQVLESTQYQAQVQALADALLPNSIPTFFHELFHLRIEMEQNSGKHFSTALENSGVVISRPLFNYLSDPREMAYLLPSQKARFQGTPFEKTYFFNQSSERKRTDLINEWLAYKIQAVWEERLSGYVSETTQSFIDLLKEILEEK